MHSYDVNNDFLDQHSLRAKVFQKVRTDILQGRYPSGKPIREGQISEELGVSRTPVREAIRQLELEGLVTFIPNKGAIVAGISLKDIEDIYAIRSLVEGLAASWAAKHITDEQLEELEEIMELADFYVQKNNFTKAFDLDSRFHQVIYNASHSRSLHHLLSSFHHYVQKARLKSISSPNRLKQAVIEHSEILKALKERDPDKASSMMTHHVKQAAINVLKSQKG